MDRWIKNVNRIGNKYKSIDRGRRNNNARVNENMNAQWKEWMHCDKNECTAKRMNAQRKE